jgi:hypothetical protein
MAGGRHFFILKSAQTGARVYTALSSIGTRDLSQGVKQLRAEANCSPHLVLRLRMGGAIPLLFHMLLFHAEGQLHFYMYIPTEKNCSDC